MKKILLGLVVVMAMSFLYIYQSPIMSTGDAIVSAEKHLQNPPKEWRKSTSNADLKEIPIANSSVFLNQKSGFWNELTNRKQWEVTIKYNGSEPTIVIDAYTGKFIDLYGPLN
ncbi:MAG: PepSY domain-containing protein [Bacillus sp. (in: firmicutes)]